MATPNIAHIEHLFQELDFRMQSLNDIFSQEINSADHALKICREMRIVHESGKNQQEYLS